MTRKSLAIASIITVLLTGLAGLLVASGLPEGTQLPVQWGLDGQPSRMAGHWEALLLPAGVTAGLSLLFYFLPVLEPRRQGLERSQGLYLWGWAGLLIVMIAVQFVTVATALGWAVDAPRVVMGAVGLLLMLLGNQLGKSRSMYMVGIRTPWTLASEEVWVKTHRLGGKLMVLAGIVLIGAALFALPTPQLALVTGVLVGIAVIVPVAYSFILWRKEQKG